MADIKHAKFAIGDVVRHRVFPFRGVVFDIDPEFDNTEQWWLAIPENIRPRKEQPFYHLYAQNEAGSYIAYVSEQNLLPDADNGPVQHPDIADSFDIDEHGRYRVRSATRN